MADDKPQPDVQTVRDLIADIPAPWPSVLKFDALTARVAELEAVVEELSHRAEEARLREAEQSRRYDEWTSRLIISQGELVVSRRGE